MPRYICKLKNKYFEWSSVVDDIVTPLMTLDEFKHYYEIEYGKKSMPELSERLARVEAIGTSYRLGESINDLIPKKKQNEIINN